MKKNRIVTVVAHVGALAGIALSFAAGCDPSQADIDNAVAQQACIILNGSGIQSQLTAMMTAGSCSTGYEVDQSATLCTAKDGAVTNWSCTQCREVASPSPCKGSATVNSTINAGITFKGATLTATGTASYNADYEYDYHNAAVYDSAGQGSQSAIDYYQSIGNAHLTGQGLSGGTLSVGGFIVSLTQSVSCNYSASAQIAKTATVPQHTCGGGAG
jgi:hypothetical protein